MLLRYFLNDFEMLSVVSVISGITFVFKFHMRCISIVRYHNHYYYCCYDYYYTSEIIKTDIPEQEGCVWDHNGGVIPCL
jgi:hypothetical protein